jgi:hypothetical protein
LILTTMAPPKKVEVSQPLDKPDFKQVTIQDDKEKKVKVINVDEIPSP